MIDLSLPITHLLLFAAHRNFQNYRTILGIFLNNIFQSDAAYEPKSAIIVFLRRLASAVGEYRRGREALVEFIALPQDTPPAITVYLKSLSHFECTIVNSYLALEAHNAIAKIISAPKAYSSGGGSSAERLGKLYTTLKHSLPPEIRNSRLVDE